LEGNPPEGAGAGRARADTAEGNVSTINIVDLRNSRKQGGFEKFLPLLKSRAKRFLYSGRDYDELVNAGAVGLGEAIANYRQGSNNGLAAFAIPHIDGAIRRFCNKSYWTVPGERNERGKHLPIASRIEHFGNVAIGDGSYKPDVSINAEIASDGEHGDDEAGGGTFLDEVVDRSLEDITGDRWWRIEQRLSERESRILLGKRRGLTNKEIGGELGVSGEAVRQALAAITKKLQREKFDLDKFSWPAHDALMFRREFEEYCRKGIGHLYRSRR
jgi:RNA polymerase sigma factor (sigma-70 family)